MIAKISDIIKAMDSLAPCHLAEEWDNIGLQVGKSDWPVKKVLIALDPTPDVIEAACSKGIDLTITHHPLILQSLKSIDLGAPVGYVIDMALRHRVGIFSAHTNLDSAKDGINDVIARRIGLRNLRVLGKGRDPDDAQGIGRIGELHEKKELANFALGIKKIFKLQSVKIVGKPDLPVRSVAVCAGSGSSLMNNFFSSGAQVFVSGDLRYHDARAVEAANLGLIDIGHFASEHLMVEVLAGRLQKILIESGIDVEVEACRLEKDPFVIL